MRTDEIVTVTSADFQRNIGLYQDQALTKPVAITKNGRPRTVLISAEEYGRLKRRDRRVLAAGEVSKRKRDSLLNHRADEENKKCQKRSVIWRARPFDIRAFCLISVRRLRACGASR